MKKVYLFVFLLMGVSYLKAQDIEDIKKYIYLNQFDKGKTELDKFIANPANAKKAEAWYYKSYLYNQLSRQPGVSAMQSSNYNEEAFNAAKKYREMDAKQPLTKEEQNGTLFNIYNNFYDLAVKAYNTKDFENSYTDFKHVLDVHDYIFSNSLVGGKDTKFSSLDTDVVYNLIILGNELKKTDELVPYYKRIIEANVTDAKYLGIYQGIVLHYKEAKDQAAFDQYLAIGKKNYPTDEFWEAVDIENATAGLQKEALFKKYDELTAKYPGSYVLFFNYGYELNKFVNSDEAKTADLGAYKARIPELFKKALAIKSTVDANMVLANFYYNNSYDLSEEAKKIKGTKPDDVKKKQELNNASKASLVMCTPVAEEAIRLYASMPKLKLTDKVNYKQALDMLFNIYKLNGDMKKAAEYDKKKQDVDKL